MGPKPESSVSHKEARVDTLAHAETPANSNSPHIVFHYHDDEMKADKQVTMTPEMIEGFLSIVRKSAVELRSDQVPSIAPYGKFVMERREFDLYYGILYEEKGGGTIDTWTSDIFLAPPTSEVGMMRMMDAFVANAIKQR